MSSDEVLDGPWGPGRPCATCGIPYPERHRDHIVPKFEGGSGDPANLQMICPNCHHLKSQAERRRMGPLISSRMSEMSPERREQWTASRALSEEGRRAKIRASWTPERKARLAGSVRGNTYQQQGTRQTVEVTRNCDGCGESFTYTRGLGRPRTLGPCCSEWQRNQGGGAQ